MPDAVHEGTWQWHRIRVLEASDERGRKIPDAMVQLAGGPVWTKPASETIKQVTSQGLRLMSNCYHSSHFHALEAML